MTRLELVPVVVMCCVGALRADTTLIEHASYAFSKQYIVSITSETLEKSPTWKEDDENPPLPARKAIRLANKMKDSLVKDSKDYKWKLQSASLQPSDAGKWYWLVHYDAEFQGAGSTGVPDHLRLVVLMDGTVVKPVTNARP
jgi:hypothetical protein